MEIFRRKPYQNLDGDPAEYSETAYKIAYKKPDYLNWQKVKNNPVQVQTLVAQEGDNSLLEAGNKKRNRIKAATVITIVTVILGLGTVGYANRQGTENVVKPPGSLLESLGRKKDQILYNVSQATTPDILK